MQRLVSFLVCLSLAIPCAAGDNIRLAFNQQCLHRTPLLQENDNQSVVNNTVGEGRLFGIFINTTLHEQISESIDTYIADLESDGWQVVLYTIEGGTSDKSDPNTWTTDDYICELEAAEQLRELLKNEYKQGMVGCILIGELPAGWVETQTGSGIGGPVDLFFRDMDGHWEDCDNNGLLDENVSTVADCKPEICNIEIWMSRLYANSLDGDEVTLMKNYFRKNHAYRIGELTLPKRALDYVDDTWACGFNVRGIYDDITQVNDNQITLASDYKERWTEGYDLIRVSVHGDGPAHHFYNIPNFATAYAHCYIHSPIAQDVRIRLGSDDGIKVWLNGENVHTSNLCRSHVFDQDAADVVLSEGWNSLLVKLCDNCENWIFSARFTDVNGLNMNNLSYSLNNLKPAQPLSISGYIRDWLINGYYKNSDKQTCLSTIDYLNGEISVTPSEGDKNGGKEEWQAYSSDTNDINLEYFFGLPGGEVNYMDVNADDPCCFFYDSYSCRTFYWWQPNYIDGWYVFSPSYGLASWGECGPVKAGTFYNSLSEGKCLGGAQLAYLNKWISVDFGMFGDPTLAPGRPRVWSPAYVDTNAVGDNNGTSWENAYTCLQDALAEASWGTEIHVARGTYWPEDGAAVNPCDRDATFRLKNGVAIKGGYAGFGKEDPNARDIDRYVTILSGEIGTPDVNDNSYHVVTASSVGTAALLGGLTITGGYADGTDANSCGGGIYIDQAHPRLIDCSVISNAADHGGGIYNNSGNPLLTRCTFSDNSASLRGGAICNYSAATSVLTNCIFSRNQARWYGGGIRELDSTSRLINCTFSSNSAGWGGGAVYSCWNSKPKLTNCILWDDTPDEIFVDHGNALPLVTYSNVQTSDQLPWPGEGNIYADPCFAEVNSPDPNDWDYHLKSQAGRWDPNSEGWVQDGVTSPCIDAGNPGCSLVDEPNEPGNIRINMGFYGGRAEASKSPANWAFLADLNNDRKVDFMDMDVFGRYWLNHGQFIPSDLNRDLSVDISDLAVFAEDWLR